MDYYPLPLLNDEARMVLNVFLFLLMLLLLFLHILKSRRLLLFLLLHILRRRRSSSICILGLVENLNQRVNPVLVIHKDSHHFVEIEPFFVYQGLLKVFIAAAHSELTNQFTDSPQDNSSIAWRGILDIDIVASSSIQVALLFFLTTTSSSLLFCYHFTLLLLLLLRLLLWLRLLALRKKKTIAVITSMAAVVTRHLGIVAAK